METIKANSLMLNDWVKIKEPNKYAGAIGTIQSLSSLEGAYFAIYICDPNFGTFVTEVFCEDIEPIPLTAEILEKNGFTRLGTNYILEGEHFGLDNPSNPNNYLDNYWLRISINAVKIEYVHELQRALRFLKINKDIVL